MKDTPTEKEESRKEEINRARNEYCFPNRTKNAPNNALKVEESMKQMMTNNGYDVKAIVVTSRWIDVKNVFGVLVYSCIDFRNVLCDMCSCTAADIQVASGIIGKCTFGSAN